jgi:hypothetical protein
MESAANIYERSRGRFASFLQLGDRLLLGLMLATVAFLLAYFSILALLPAAWQTPGSPPLSVLGIMGAALLLVSIRPTAF